MMTPEQQARRNIDKMLEAAGWHVQNHAGHNTAAALAHLPPFFLLYSKVGI